MARFCRVFANGNTTKNKVHVDALLLRMPVRMARFCRVFDANVAALLPLLEKKRHFGANTVDVDEWVAI
jgi:hypothetical protein